MKKTLIIAAALALSAVASQAQGLVSLAINSAVVYTNNSAGTALGKANNLAAGGYYFELLTSANLGISTSANNVQNPANLALWTDTGVLGTAGQGLSAGKVNGSASAPATGWAAPGATEDDEQSYIIVGWSSVYGTTWSQVAAEINGGGLAAGGYFGTSVVAYNVAGGGPDPLPAVVMWNNQTGTTGYGLSGANQLILTPVGTVPEPGTIALAGLGGLSLLAFRRKK